MTREQAWAAGLFDGEGCATKASGGRARLQLKMVDEECVRRFHRAVGGIGTVYGPYAHKTPIDGYPRSSFFVWVADQENAVAVATMLYPLLSTKRRMKISELGLVPESMAA